MPHNRRSKRNLRGREIHDVRVLLSTYDSRGGIEPLAALGVRLRELGAEAVVRGHHDDRHPGRRAPGRRAPVGRPAVLRRPGGRAGHRRVAELGIGAAHAVQAPTTESLAAALGIALDPGTRARAKAVAGTIRTDGTTVAAELLLSSATA